MTSHFDINEYIVVEFSLSQKAFNKQTVKDMLEYNRYNMMKRNQTDYLPVAIYPTHELADDFISKTYDIIKNYQMFEDTGGKIIVTE